MTLDVILVDAGFGAGALTMRGKSSLDSSASTHHWNRSQSTVGKIISPVLWHCRLLRYSLWNPTVVALRVLGGLRVTTLNNLFAIIVHL